MEIYILVNVYYDHYRFQDIVNVFSEIEDAELFCKENYPKSLVKKYNENYNEFLDKTEKCHLQIRKEYLK